eukprot:1194810-Prorocentrum_minimum.AAC.3
MDAVSAVDHDAKEGRPKTWGDDCGVFLRRAPQLGPVLDSERPGREWIGVKVAHQGIGEGQIRLGQTSLMQCLPVEADIRCRRCRIDFPFQCNVGIIACIQ